MARKKFEITILPEVEIVDIAEEGKGVAKVEELVVFVDKGIPGDIVDVRLMRKKKNYAEGQVNRILRPSEYRTEPFCAHFGTCGGCKWQHMTYEAQLKFKAQNVGASLQRLGKIDVRDMKPILGSAKNTYYRNKMEYTFSNKRWLESLDQNEEPLTTAQLNALGFHVPGRFDKILDIEHCYLQGDSSNEIRNAVREYALEHQLSFYDLRNHEGCLRNLIIRTSTTGELMVAVIFAYPKEDEIVGLMAFLRDRFPAITSLLYVVNQKRNDTIFDQEVEVYAGNDYIFEEMDGLKFKIGLKSFYQTNSEQAFELYKITKNLAGLKGDELVYDLYTGAGTIANFVARDARQVVGIEYVPTAIEDAKFNAKFNGIKNTLFYAGDMKDILTAEFVAQHGKPDVVITDPPRAGMHADVVARLLEMQAEKIVYVSCNAATQARDLALLSELYEVKEIQPVDMFPHTQHVENVVLLQLKK